MTPPCTGKFESVVKVSSHITSKNGQSRHRPIKFSHETFYKEGIASSAIQKLIFPGQSAIIIILSHLSPQHR